MSREEKAMNKLLEFNKQLDEIANKVSIENTTDNPLVDAYNDGVKALAANIRYYILKETNTFDQVAIGGEE